MKFELIVKDGPRDFIIGGQLINVAFDIRELIKAEALLSKILGLKIHIIEAQLAPEDKGKT